MERWGGLLILDGLCLNTDEDTNGDRRMVVATKIDSTA